MSKKSQVYTHSNQCLVRDLPPKQHGGSHPLAYEHSRHIGQRVELALCDREIRSVNTRKARAVFNKYIIGVVRNMSIAVSCVMQ